MIGIFSHQKATECDRVVKSLNAGGRECIRVNMGDGESQPSVLLTTAGDTVDVTCDGRSVHIADVNSAWLHQLPPLVSPEDDESKMSGSLRQGHNSSRLRLWQFVLDQVSAQAWLSPPSAVTEAANKLRQYGAAKSAGLSIPSTVVAMEVSTITAALGDNGVVKYLGDSSALWSSTPAGQAALTIDWSRKGLHLIDAPALFQTKIDTEFEYRVVMVGDGAGGGYKSFWAVATKPQNVTDIRLAGATIPTYSPVEAPVEVNRGLERLLEVLNLGFCSADFVSDSAGNFWFLDLNVTGAWWWIDDIYSGAVTEAIVESLVAKADN